LFEQRLQDQHALEDFSMPSNSWNHLIRISLAALICGFGVCASAQVLSPANSDELITPKVELFGGYSYFDPGTALHGILPGGTLPFSECLCSIPRGAGASATYNFNRWLGLTLDTSGHWSPHASTLSASISNSAFYSLSLGPTFTFRTRHLSPFLEGLAGGQRLTPEIFHPDDSFGFLAGGGLDWNLGRHFAIRVAQADYVFSNHQFGPSSIVQATDIRGLRLQSGVVFMFGGARPVTTVHEVPAAPVVAAPLPAKSLAPLAITCSAVPAMVGPGETSTISARVVSADDRPVTYSYISSTGSVTGTGSTVTLTTAGASPGEVRITCAGTDDAGQSATHNTAVTITAPVAVTKPTTSSLCSITFDRDTARPARVNNEAKACLDEIALSLQQHSDATLAIVGTSAGSGGNALASQRAANTKAYLVTEKGVDPSRIELFTGTEPQNVASSTLIPPGASFDNTSLTPVRSGATKARRHDSGPTQ
jgi:outer membrane protein OmpA-like peptidoglycan-associated protein